MKKAVIFDLDGTLLNTLEDIADSVNASLRHFSLPEVTLEKVRESVGNGGRTLMERVVQGGSAYERFEELLEYYVPYYQAHCRIKTAPYSGICEAMSELKAMNIKMAIVSNKGDGAVKELADAYFGNLCETAVGERDGIRRKPAPDSVIEAMKLLGSLRRRLFMQGIRRWISKLPKMQAPTACLFPGDFVREHCLKVLALNT